MAIPKAFLNENIPFINDSLIFPIQKYSFLSIPKLQKKCPQAKSHLFINNPNLPPQLLGLRLMYILIFEAISLLM